jgi:hypothetical protein
LGRFAGAGFTDYDDDCNEGERRGEEKRKRPVSDREEGSEGEKRKEKNAP